MWKTSRDQTHYLWTRPSTLPVPYTCAPRTVKSCSPDDLEYSLLFSYLISHCNGFRGLLEVSGSYYDGALVYTNLVSFLKTHTTTSDVAPRFHFVTDCHQHFSYQPIYFLHLSLSFRRIVLRFLRLRLRRSNN